MLKFVSIPVLALLALSWLAPVDLADSPNKLQIHSADIPLRHLAPDAAIRTLQWDDMNDLPAGVLDVVPVPHRRAVRVEGTQGGLDAAARAIALIDIAPRRARLLVQFAECRRAPAVSPGHLLPSPKAVLASAFLVVTARSPEVENNADGVPRMRSADGRRDLDTGIRFSPRIGDNGSVTLHGTMTFATMLGDLDLKSADVDSIGGIELVRNIPSGRTAVLGRYRVLQGAFARTPIFLYVLITPIVDR